MRAQTALESQGVAASTGPTIVDADSLLGLMNEVNGSIARRAFELFENRNGETGHEVEDWFRAESELLHPVPVDIKKSDNQLLISAEVPGYTPADIQVGIEARRLFISSGFEQRAKSKRGETIYTERRSEQIFRTLELPATVDPNNVNATCREGMLYLTLPVAETSEPTTLNG